MAIWVTSDTHFNHDHIRKYCERPFSSCDEMDGRIIYNWNTLVQAGDTIYHLGDFCFGKQELIKQYRYRLNGKIHLILGNHDYKNKLRNVSNIFSSVNDLLEIKYNGQRIILCHYAMRTWSSSHSNSIQLYGHSHGNMPGVGKQMDVGVDCWDFKPISIDQVIAIMETRPNNATFIPPEQRNKL